MKHLKKLLFAGLLVGAAMVTAPKAAQAGNPWCNQCDASGGTNCVACCVCGGGTIARCSILCS